MSNHFNDYDISCKCPTWIWSATGTLWRTLSINGTHERLLYDIFDRAGLSHTSRNPVSAMILDTKTQIALSGGQRGTITYSGHFFQFHEFQGFFSPLLYGGSKRPSVGYEDRATSKRVDIPFGRRNKGLFFEPSKKYDSRKHEVTCGGKIQQVSVDYYEVHGLEFGRDYWLTISDKGYIPLYSFDDYVGMRLYFWLPYSSTKLNVRSKRPLAFGPIVTTETAREDLKRVKLGWTQKTYPGRQDQTTYFLDKDYAGQADFDLCWRSRVDEPWSLWLIFENDSTLFSGCRFIGSAEFEKIVKIAET